MSHSYFCLLPQAGEKKRGSLEVQLYRMCLKDQGQSGKSEKYPAKMGTPRFTMFTVFTKLFQRKDKDMQKLTFFVIL